MVEVSIEVCNGAARFSVAVRAESIERAVDLVGRRYPGADVWVKFPIDPEGFFVKDPAAAGAGIVGLEQPDRKRREAGAKEGLESMHQSVESTAYCLDCTTQERMGDPSLWERILVLIEQDLAERRSRKLFVEVQDESGSYRKEIGELSASERRSLHPLLRERVAERVLDRYLAGQGYVDLADQRRAYTKKIEDLTPEDLPALVEADRLRAQEEHEKEHERAEFVQEVQAVLERLPVLELAGKMAEAGEGVVR